MALAPAPAATAVMARTPSPHLQHAEPPDRNFIKRGTEKMLRSTMVGGMDDPKLRRADQLELLECLVKRGDGCILRGWRKELDSEGHLEVTFPAFCEAARRMGYSGDAHLLFGIDHDYSSLTLSEIAPSEGELFDRFKQWVREKFGAPREMFKTFDTYGRGSVTREAFVAACRDHGFEAPGDTLHQVYNCCDFNDVGSVVWEDVIFLEVDQKIREDELYRIKLRHMYDWKQAVAKDYVQHIKSLNSEYPIVHSKHRLAPRPWQARTFEGLPSVVCHLRHEEQRNAARRARSAGASFLQHIRKIFHNEVRAFRTAFDKNGDYSVSLNELRRYCRVIDLNVNMNDLWKGLKKDDETEVSLEELCMEPAMALAPFRLWSRRQFGSCAAIWDLPEAVLARRTRTRTSWTSEKKMMREAVAEVLNSSYGWQSVAAPEAQSLVLSSLDLYGCGLIMRSDLEWLDGWKAPEWLAAEPDASAWAELKALLVQAYRHPLRAWRALDKDNSNKISWAEFTSACKKLHFHGNMGGAWRSVDTNLSGYISMREFDETSSDLLQSFKDWADFHFGSVRRCFKALDSDQSGLVTFHELKRACLKMKWRGDLKVLFECLDLDSLSKRGERRAITLEEVVFLDTWQVESPHEDLPEEVDAAEEAVTFFPTNPSRAQPGALLTSGQRILGQTWSSRPATQGSPKAGSPKGPHSGGRSPLAAGPAAAATAEEWSLPNLPCPGAWGSEPARPRHDRSTPVLQSPYYSMRQAAKAPKRPRRGRDGISCLDRCTSAPGTIEPLADARCKIETL